jgi:hypothetical protein
VRESKVGTRRSRPRASASIVAEGESFARLRGAFLTIVNEHWLSLRTAARFVGGVHHVRDHRGRPDARPPFTPVPAEQQRAAVALLVDQAFDEDAGSFEAGLLNRLPPNRFYDWSTPFNQAAAVDFLVHQQIVTLQRSLLVDLLNTAPLGRIVDNAVRMPAGEEAYELWSSWGRSRRPCPPSSAHPESRLTMRPRSGAPCSASCSVSASPSSWARGPRPRSPCRPRTRARSRVTSCAGSPSAWPRRSSRGGLEVVNTAHLEESVARIERALDASMTVEGD